MTALTGFVLKRGQNDVLVQNGGVSVGVDGGVTEPDTALSDLVSGGVDVNKVSVGSAGQAHLAHQALFVQLVAELQTLAELIGNDGRPDLAVGDVVDIAGIPVNECVHDVLDNAATAGRVCSDGNFVLLAVAVGVAVTESNQNLVQLVDGGGNFQAQLVQPFLVDEDHIGQVINVLQSDQGHTVVAAVVGIHALLQSDLLVGIVNFLQSFLEVGEVGLQVGCQIQNVAVLAQVAQVVVGHTVEAPDNVGDLLTCSAVQRELLVLLIGVRGVVNELQLDLKLLFDPLGEIVVGVAGDVSRLGNAHGQGNAAVLGLEFYFVLAASAAACQKSEDHHSSQGQCQYSFHCLFSPYLNKICKA